MNVNESRELTDTELEFVAGGKAAAVPAVLIASGVATTARLSKVVAARDAARRDGWRGVAK